MQVSEHHGNIRLDFNYSPAIISQIKKIPGWKYNKTPLGVFWTIPCTSLPVAKNAKLISDGHLYPNVKPHISPNIFKDLSVTVKSFAVMASGLPIQLKYFMTCVSDLCSYEDRVKIENDNPKAKVEYEYIIKTIANITFNKYNTVVMEFPEGLYQRVLAWLSLYQFEKYEVRPYHQKPESSLNLILQGVTPRPYQQKASDRVVSGEINNRATLSMATGSGKTILSALITAQLAVPTIFYTYSKELLDQTAEAYENLFGIEVGRIGGNRFSIQPITIASIQTVHSCWKKQDNRWEKLSKYLQEVQCMFVDEGHTLGAETIFNVANITNAYYSFALTATPYREDGKELFIEAGTGSVVELISEQELVKGGFVLPVEVEIYPVQHFINRKKNYHKLYDSEIIDHWERNRKIIKSVRKHQGKQVIVLVKEIDHGKKISEVLSAPFIHGSTPGKVRRKALEDFKTGVIDVIVASSILKQGVDLPEAEVLVLAHGGSSLVELMQKVGRVRRPAEGKIKGIVVDFYDHTEPNVDSDVFRGQSEKRIAFYKLKGFNITKIND